VSDEATRLRQWQTVTVATLFTGYAGYYVCRSVLPVVSNQLVGDPELHFDDQDYGRLGAIGIYMYAIGKLFNGVFTEYAGARFMFLVGMLLSAACVVAFGMVGGFTALAVIWGINRFVQSMGWGSLVKITGNWFAPQRLATVMAVLSLSYLFGDALARLYLGLFVKSAGFGWREVFFVAAGTLTVIGLVAFLTLKQRPSDLGLPEPPPPPRNVHGADDHGHGHVSFWKLLGPLFASRMFWLVCLLNMGLTAIRETFNYWTPRYLKREVGMSDADASLLSFLFPLCGAVACLAAGWGADRLRGHFGRIIVPFMVLTTATLWAFANTDLHGRTGLALLLIAGVALFAMGPYSFCSGVLALNLGGQRAGAASAGIIDSAGYFCGAVISGEVSGYLVTKYGFVPLLDVLFWLSATTLVVGIVYWILEERQLKALPPEPAPETEPEPDW
jgi:OPA family glycerol-3-phosphate transporter-like MFS transporter